MLAPAFMARLSPSAGSTTPVTMDAAAEAQKPLRIRAAGELLDLDVELLIARHEAEDLVTLLLPKGIVGAVNPAKWRRR